MTTTTAPHTGVGSRNYEGRYDIDRMIADAKTVINQAIVNLAGDPRKDGDAREAKRASVETRFTPQRTKDVVAVLNYITTDKESQAKMTTSQLHFHSAFGCGSNQPAFVEVRADNAEQFGTRLRTIRSILESPASAREFTQRAIDNALPKRETAMVGS